MDTNLDSAATQALLERACAGDHQAFETLFRRHEPFLRQVVSLRMDKQLKTRIDDSDVLQETYLEAFQRLDEFAERRPMPFRIWLRQTACQRVQRLREHHGAARRAMEREVPLPDGSSLQLARQLMAGSPSPSQSLSRGEIVRAVRASMAELSETDREVLLMRNFEGLSHNEIAASLEITPAAARQRFVRALLKLQVQLAQRGLMEAGE